MMPLADIFFMGIVLYLLYRFIFGFVVPVARTTRHVREQFRNMQDPTQDPRQNASGPFRNAYNNRPADEPQSAKPGPGPSRPKNTMGEYIDFEEIK